MARGEGPPSVLRCRGLVLNQAKQEVIVDGQAHHLTPKECQLLACFMQYPGEVLTRKFLMQEVWGTDFTDDTRTIEVHVSWVRSKIEEDPSDPRYILTVRGLGYVFSRDGRV